MTAAQQYCEPLVPADVDLRDFGFMPLDVLRLRDSDLATEASGDEFKAAVLLWCAAWHQIPAGSIPNREAWLIKQSGAGTLPAWRKVRDMALRGFVECSDGRLYHRVIAEKAVEAWTAKQARRERTAAATAAREAKRREQQHVEQHVQRDEKTDVQRNVERDVHQGTGTGTGTGTVKGQGDLVKTPRAARTAPARVPLPPDFAISDRVRRWAAEKGFGQMGQHLDAFVRKATANAYRYADWDAAFMEAVREDWAKLRGRTPSGAAPAGEHATVSTHPAAGSDWLEQDRKHREAVKAERAARLARSAA